MLRLLCSLRDNLSMIGSAHTVLFSVERDMASHQDDCWLFVLRAVVFPGARLIPCAYVALRDPRI